HAPHSPSLARRARGGFARRHRPRVRRAGHRPGRGLDSTAGGRLMAKAHEATLRRFQNPAVRQSAALDDLVRQAVFGSGPEREQARWLIWEIGQQAGVRPASIHELYLARGRGEVPPFTTPAMNVRMLAYDTARAVFRAARRIDVDTSTLVDLSQQTLDEQQRVNYERAAEFTKFIRDREPEGVTVSVGAEIGEVGGKNSDVHELKAFMDGYTRTLKRLGPYAGI